MIEGLIVLALFVALALLAVRYGADSRDGIRSKEHDLALRGVAWRDPGPRRRSSDGAVARAGLGLAPATRPTPLADPGRHHAAAREQEVAA
jgi:hypothetical protein